MSTEERWTIAGTLLIGTTLLLMLYAEFIAPYLQRKRRLKILSCPADVSFLISKKTREVDYAEQDDDDHLVKKLVLKSHSVHVVEILIQPTTHFATIRTLFGSTHPEIWKCPRPTEYSNRYVAKGDKKEGIPGRDPGHNLLENGQYQHDYDTAWSVGHHIITGYKIETRESGIYPFVFAFVGEAVEGSISDLEIEVVDAAPLMMKCVSIGHDHKIKPKL